MARLWSLQPPPAADDMGAFASAMNVVSRVDLPGGLRPPHMGHWKRLAPSALGSSQCLLHVVSPAQTSIDETAWRLAAECNSTVVLSGVCNLLIRSASFHGMVARASDGDRLSRACRARETRLYDVYGDVQR